MTEQTGTNPAETDEQRIANHTWKRRGLIAAAWAAVQLYRRGAGRRRVRAPAPRDFRPR
jgi:hypothetical protein